MVDKRGVEGVPREGVGVADDDELHAGACDGYVHAAQVVEEAELSAVVVAHHADNDNVAFLPLEAVDGVDGYLPPQATVEVVHLEEAAYEAHLCAVGRDDAEVDVVGREAFEAYHVDVVAQRVYDEPSLVGVDAAERTVLPLGEAALRGVDPREGCVHEVDEAVGHLGSGVQCAVVEPARGEVHDVAVHAVLRGE